MSFRTVVHSDGVCRLVFEPETGNFWRYRGAVGNHLIPDIVTPPPATSVYAIFRGVLRPARFGVLNSSPYAYQKAVSLVLAIKVDVIREHWHEVVCLVASLKAGPSRLRQC